VDEKRRSEDEWFLKNERELLETARLARQKREKERREKEKTAELDRLKAIHFMRCPKCGHAMVEESLEDIKIDRCSLCEGIYFDAGELDRAFLKKEEERRGLFRKLLKI
jgi:hypothetical protein